MSNPWATESSSREPFFKLPPVILLLLAIMVGVYAVLTFSTEATQLRLVNAFGFVPSHYGAGAQHGDRILALIWPFFTHLFLHGNLAHLVFNSLWLMAVGTPLARRLGPVAFLAFYFVCGALSATAHLAANLGSPIPVIGASGAIAGCMAGAIRVMFASSASYFTKAGSSLSLAPLTDKRIVVVSMMWLLINALMGSGLLPMPGQGSAGIAWEAHIGGYFAGLLLIPIFDRWAGGRARSYGPNGP